MKNVWFSSLVLKKNFVRTCNFLVFTFLIYNEHTYLSWWMVVHLKFLNICISQAWCVWWGNFEVDNHLPCVPGAGGFLFQPQNTPNVFTNFIKQTFQTSQWNHLLYSSLVLRTFQLPLNMTIFDIYLHLSQMKLFAEHLD